MILQYLIGFLNLVWAELQQRPFKVGILSSSGSISVYFLQTLTNENFMKVGAFFAMLLGIVLTALSIWLTLIRIRKERNN